jgi:hypothetical protein
MVSELPPLPLASLSKCSSLASRIVTDILDLKPFTDHSLMDTLQSNLLSVPIARVLGKKDQKDVNLSYLLPLLFESGDVYPHNLITLPTLGYLLDISSTIVKTIRNIKQTARLANGTKDFIFYPISTLRSCLFMCHLAGSNTFWLTHILHWTDKIPLQKWLQCFWNKSTTVYIVVSLLTSPIRVAPSSAYVGSAGGDT